MLYAHPRGTDQAKCLTGIDGAAKLARFSKGFYRIDMKGDVAVVSDLRMGLTSNYVFRFVVARRTANGFEPVTSRLDDGDRRAPGDVDWLLSGLSGKPTVRPIEANAAVDATRLASLVLAGNGTRNC